MLSVVQNGNGTPHDIRGIAHARTNRKVFRSKNFCGLGYIHWRQGIKPFQAEQFRLKSCSTFTLQLELSINHISTVG